MAYRISITEIQQIEFEQRNLDKGSYKDTFF